MIRACWCSFDGTEKCETCAMKVYYPEDVEKAEEKAFFFEADEDDFYYPV